MINKEQLILGNCYLIKVKLGTWLKAKLMGKRFDDTYEFLDPRNSPGDHLTSINVPLHAIRLVDDPSLGLPSTPANPRKDIVRELGDVWNKFLSLTTNTSFNNRGENINIAKLNINPDDIEDFKDAIHTCQRILATQELKQQYPDFFN